MFLNVMKGTLHGVVVVLDAAPFSHARAEHFFGGIPREALMRK
jgi:hypothetical protein